MKQIVAWVQGFAMTIGGPGLFVIAFLDSSLLSLPEINDLLIVVMVTQHPERMPFYAITATLGSVTGCFLMYWIGAKGGEPLLRRRFSGRNFSRVVDLYGRYGVLAVVVPAILPPPAPFKIFVLMAGVARMRPLTFGCAVAAGRGFRYFAEGLLAVWYGRQALDYIHEHGRNVSLALAAIVVAAVVAWLLYRRRGRAL